MQHAREKQEILRVGKHEVHQKKEEFPAPKK